MRNPLFARCYDQAMAAVERDGLAELRTSLLADAHGTVLEIGAGTGANAPHYPATVTRLILTDPWPAMLDQLRTKVAGRSATQVWAADGHALPVADGTVDEVVTTLVLCSVADRDAVAAEIRRVLRPGGVWRFLEHVAAGDAGPSWSQRFWQPFQRLVADGCRLDLRMEPVLDHAGFPSRDIAHLRLPGGAPWLTPAVRGVAHARP